MTKVVLDASALIAFLLDEPGEKVVSAVIDNFFISSVNFAEVISKFSERGMSHSEAKKMLAVFVNNVIDFDTSQAFKAGELRRNTKHLGLSLGDRACLALATTLNLTAYTCDESWRSTGLKVKVIR